MKRVRTPLTQLWSPEKSRLPQGLARNSMWLEDDVEETAGDEDGQAGRAGHEPLSHASKFSRRRQWHPTPVLLSGKPHEWRSLVGCSRGVATSRTRLRDSLSLFTLTHWRRKSNPLQCSYLENPRDGGAWWAAVSGVAQSPTRLK